MGEISICSHYTVRVYVDRTVEWSFYMRISRKVENISVCKLTNLRKGFCKCLRRRFTMCARGHRIVRPGWGQATSSCDPPNTVSVW